jgi:hypothetical protein
MLSNHRKMKKKKVTKDKSEEEKTDKPQKGAVSGPKHKTKA